MKRKLALPPSETAMRIEATTPTVNAWVMANAGSGKTSILRDRVIRMLLDGIAPDRILCLTFTRAAAAEMQSRIFDALAGWVALSDEALGIEIDRLTGTTPEELAQRPRRIRRARRLFAEAVETPGGLKIQTIHGFAERILHLFPIEAGVPVDFAVMEEADAHALCDAARRAVLDDALTTPDSALGRAFGTILDAAGLEGYRRAVDEAVNALADIPPETGDTFQTYRDLFAIPEQTSEASLEAELLASLPSRADARDFAFSLAGMAKTAKTTKAAEALVKFADAIDPASQIAPLLALCLTDKNELIKPALVEAAIDKKLPNLAAIVNGIKAHVGVFHEARRALKAAERSAALTRFARAVLARYEAGKAARNQLDFSDLIGKLRAMLLAGHAAWVMMKLDAAIDHILVDEAQDTTPRMWDIIRLLADDFFSGEGQVRRPRSIFVVGDEKQSIFSFQGAEPRVFDELRGHFARRIPPESLAPGGLNRVEKPVRLVYSFRSSPDILAAVDAVFADDAARAGLSADPEPPHHIAAHENFPGRVELWPIEEALTLAPADEDADAPVDAPSPTGAPIRSAIRVAETIAGWLRNGERHLSDGKLVRPGDILILAQTRGEFFRAVLRELKLRKIPVAGADRLKLLEEIAIHDLMATAEAALLPEDDLKLAITLKAPVFGLDDAALARIARGRSGSLRAALANAARDDAGFAAIEHRFATLEGLARRAGPFAFFCNLLTGACPHGAGISGRKAMLGRLGPDAGEAIDAFLGDALEFSRRHPDFLLPFIVAQRARAADIKRDLDQGDGLVRVMTSHASKGLEARIVFLCDAMRKPERAKESATLVVPGSERLIWAGKKDEEPALFKDIRAGARQRQFEEYRRLLYVGMTRAEERLHVVGHRIRKPPNPDKPAVVEPLERSWHALVVAGLAGRPEITRVAQGEGTDLLRWVSRTLAASAALIDEETPRQIITLPPWLFVPVPAEALPLPPLRPSRAQARLSPARGEDEASDDARRLGVLVHSLFEHLPDIAGEDRMRVGGALVRHAMPMLSPDAVGALLAPVLACLAAPGHEGFFGPGSRAEIAISGSVILSDGTMRAVSARIDRLVVREERIDILDLKSGRPRKAAEDAAIMRQMALYRALVQAIYPGRPVGAHVLWSASASLETLSDAALDAAFVALATTS